MRGSNNDANKLGSATYMGDVYGVSGPQLQSWPTLDYSGYLRVNQQREAHSSLSQINIFKNFLKNKKCWAQRCHADDKLPDVGIP